MIHRNNIRSCSIISFYHDFILSSKFQSCSYLKSKSTITSFMGSYKLTVNIYLGVCAHTFKPKKHTLPFQFFIKELFFLVIANSFIKRSSLYLHIFSIPCVRQTYSFPFPLPLSNNFYWVFRKRTAFE